MVYIVAFFQIFLWIIVIRQNNEITNLKQQMDIIKSMSSNKKDKDEKTDCLLNNSDNIVMDTAQPEILVSDFSQAQQGYFEAPSREIAPPKAQDDPSASRASESMDEKMKGTAESWFGRNVIGIVASILVFIGLIFLGVLAYEYITQTGKIIAMYSISFVILATGIGLTLKWRNNFTITLMGCGCGLFFISILLTHVYFNRINDITAFSLLLVWLIATLYLSKRATSTLLSIVAHIGMVISVCFAFALGLSDEKLLILLIYQGVASAIILFGNILFCRKTYNAGIIVSLAMTVVASLFMWARFAWNGAQNVSAFATSLPTGVITFAFIAQFIFACFLSFLLSNATNRFKHSDLKVLIQIINKALWITSLIVNIYLVVYKIVLFNIGNSLQLTNQLKFTAILSTILVTFAVILLHSALTIILSIRLNFSRMLASISIFLLSGVTLILLLVLWHFEQYYNVEAYLPNITWFFVVSLLFIFVKHLTQNKVYSIGANVVLCFDAIFMFYYGYKVLDEYGTVYLSLGYLILYLIIILLQWLMLDSDGRKKHSKLIRLFSYILTEISLVKIMLSSSLEYKTVLLLIILTALNTLLYVVRFDRDTDNSSIMKIVFGLNEFVLLIVVSSFIAFSYKDSTSTVLYLVLSALAFGLAFIRIRNIYDGTSSSIQSIWTGLKLTILVLAIIQGNTTWLEQTYVFSVVCMLTALLCIIFGFMARVKDLRLYGLALTLMCVIKLVTFDVSKLESIIRVIAFIGGGIICFIISAIYNYTTKRFLINQNNETR